MMVVCISLETTGSSRKPGAVSFGFFFFSGTGLADDEALDPVGDLDLLFPVLGLS